MHLGKRTDSLIWTKSLRLCPGKNVPLSEKVAGGDLLHSECKHYERSLPKYAWYVILATDCL